MPFFKFYAPRQYRCVFYKLRNGPLTAAVFLSSDETDASRSLGGKRAGIEGARRCAQKRENKNGKPLPQNEQLPPLPLQVQPCRAESLLDNEQLARLQLPSQDGTLSFQSSKLDDSASLTFV